jgi:Fe-S cluster assembly iron-binding protein IscA
MVRMVALTERAGELLERFQTEQALPHALRIDFTSEGGELTMGMSEPRADDEQLYHGENIVLYISAPAAEALAGCTVTTQETPQGIALALTREAEAEEE